MASFESHPIIATYINGFSGADKESMPGTKFNTAIMTFLSFYSEGGTLYGVIDGSMGAYNPGPWIRELRDNGKTVMFSIGGSAVPPSALEFLFSSTDSADLNTLTYGQFRDIVNTVLKGGKMTMKTTSHQDYPTDYGPGFNGVDFDLENFSSYSTNDTYCNLWADRLANLTYALHNDLPAGTLITHAPQTPYMLSSDGWPAADGSNPDGLYTKMMNKAGDAVSWLNVQIYNQGNFSGQQSLNDMLSVLIKTWAESVNVGPEKIVVTIPFSTGEAGNGYVSPSMLATGLKSVTGAAPGGLNGWAYDAYGSVSPPWDQQFTDMLK